MIAQERALHQRPLCSAWPQAANVGGLGQEELELTFNYDGRTYELGKACGYVARTVDDLDETLARLAEQGIQPERERYCVRERGSRLTFVTDPDGYRVELIERSS